MDISRMKNQIIAIDKNRMQGKADKYFKRICGADIEGEQKETFLKEIEKAETHVLNHMQPKVIFSYYDMDGGCNPMKIENEVFHGGIFNYYKRSSVKGVLIYLLTIGGLHKEDDMKLLRQYYLDAWGSAYVEAAHDVFKEELVKIFQGVEKKDKPYYVSEPFGPGYFDIAITDTEKLFHLLKHEELCLNLSEGGMMNPEKSCSGFYIISEEEIAFPEDNCISCKAKVNCDYCRKKNV